MGNKNWLAMIVITIMVVLACTAPSASPTTGPTTAPTTAPTDAEPTDAEPTDAEPTDAEPTDAEPTDAEPTDAEPTDAEPTDAEPTDAEPTSEPGGAAVPPVPTGYAELDLALGADKPYNGKRVTIQTQWIGGEGANFDAAISDFEAATGIDIVQESIASQHEVVLRTRIDGGTPPDLAMLAQPSAVVAYGDRAQVIDVATIMDPATLNEQFSAGFGTSLVSGPNGEIWGIPFKVDVKSTIWYPIKAFENAGYTVPTTWEELEALAAQIVADGNGSPWCLGILDGAATGWIATDWLEDVMLRTAGIDAYNAWISHELPFDSPEVRAALDVLAEQWFTEGYVFGGSEAITATDRLEGWDPMFAPDNNWDGFTPGCWMHRQATWIGPDFFPDKRANSDPNYVSQYVLGEDIGIMYFPTIDSAQGTPALGAGDTLMVLVDDPARPEIRAVAQFLSTPYGLQRWIERGSAISANQTTPDEWYAGSYKLAVAADIVGNSTSFGFDASDLMPPAVGAGTFWSGMVEWIDAGGTNTDTVLQNIDASWPST
jgi:alpha-glucoside transport system substrate-binding protein